jgi:hypothetical protein
VLRSGGAQRLNMKRIPLSGKHGIGKFAIVDDEDYDRLVAMGKWQARHHRGKTYASHGTSDKNDKKITLLMHRVISNAPRGVPVDHADGNSLDNRRSNIRLCNFQQNSSNARTSKKNTSGYKGVSFQGGTFRAKPWRVQIQYKKRKIYLGNFLTKQEAARTYNQKAVELFGEFAWINPI